MTLADIKNYVFFRTGTVTAQWGSSNADLLISLNSALERVETVIRQLLSEYNPTRFTSSDLSTGTAVPKFHSRFHELLPLWICYQYAVSKNSANKNDFLAEIKTKESEMTRWYALRNYKVFTVTIASPGVFTLKRHNFVKYDKVIFETSGSLPTGLSADTWYFIISDGLDDDNFRVSSTRDGDAINTSGSQSGTHFISVDKQPTLRTYQEDNR